MQVVPNLTNPTLNPPATVVEAKNASAPGGNMKSNFNLSFNNSFNTSFATNNNKTEEKKPSEAAKA